MSSGYFVFPLDKPAVWYWATCHEERGDDEGAVRQRTDCTSTNGLVAPRRVRTQIRTAQPGSIRSAGLGAIAAA